MWIFRNTIIMTAVRVIVVGMVIGILGYMGIELYRQQLKAVKDKEDYERAKEECLKYAAAFSGLLEPLYMMDIGKIKPRSGILGDFFTRMEHMPEAPYMRQVFLEYMKEESPYSLEDKIRYVMTFLIDVGAKRSTEEMIIVDSDTYSKYQSEEEERIEEGHSATVVMHYWSIEGKVIEKGIIKKLAEGEEG